MVRHKLPGPVLIALAILMWAIFLWVFTIGYPGMKPVAYFIFMVLVLPNGLVEWLKIKGLIRGKMILPARLSAIGLMALIWTIWR